MSVFFHRHNVNFPKFVCLFQKYLKQLKTLTKLTTISWVYLHRVSTENTNCLLICANFSKSTHSFANFTIGMIGNKMGPLLKCVKLYGNCINILRILIFLGETKYISSSVLKTSEFS